MTQTDPHRHKAIVELERQADLIAQDASETLMAVWSDTISGLPTRTSEPVDEAFLMMKDGFKRLGEVVRFALLVDEPDLIVDDMLWLKRMFGERQIVPGPPNWDTMLLEAYLNACLPHLGEAQQILIQDLVSKAVAALSAGPVSEK